MNTLSEFLAEAVREREAEPFLTDLRDGETISYRELSDRAHSASAWLAEQGVGLGDRVAYVTQNSPNFFPLLFACVHRGAAFVPINVAGTPAETKDVLEDCEAKVVLADAVGEEGWIVADDDVLFNRTESSDAVDCPPEQDAIFIYTSGTTGRSKGVILSHRALKAMATTLATVYGYAPGMRFLSMLPNYHINAPVVTGLAIVAGRSHVFVTDPYGFTNARLIFPYVEEHKLDVLSVTPSIMASLLKFNPGGTESDLETLKFALVGTAHLPEKPWRKFEEIFGVPCYQGYGLTETTTWSTMTPPDERKRYDSAGVAIDCEVRIDEEGGEILIRGDSVMNGYNKRKALTRKSFKDGWFRTGDIGRIDDDGQLFITGRIKNIIKRRGILISPEEIDGVLRKFEGTQDACTIGVPDELSGERVVSACVIDEDQVNALGAFARETLSAYKYPDEVLVIAAIPKTNMGKPDLKELRRIATGEKMEAIVESFDAYRFRRAHTPDMPVIKERIQAALLRGTTVDFSGYWGVGSRDAIAKPDRVAIDRLAKFLDAINTVAGRPLATMTLILADMHARCNQVPTEVHEPYFAGIDTLAKEHGFKTHWLSAVWEKHNLDFARVTEQMSTNQRLEAWETFELREEFIQQAAKRCGGDEALVEEFAYRYFLTIGMENEAVAKSYADTIFFTYNGLEARESLPVLPMVHLHSLKPGTAAKPWFRN
ncbi:MAG: long-chain acyl-CoA synthetase [Planctomycetota bacterium]|jgi:long-chain acyl-CoA synthetase